jgi:hypothetical protein
MKSVLALLICASLIGCASNNIQAQSAAEKYAQEHMPLVEQGKLKRSDYYIGFYDAVASQPDYTTGDILKVINNQIKAALDYEANKITKEEYESHRRNAIAQHQKIQSDYQLKIEQINASRPVEPTYIYQPPVINYTPMQTIPQIRSPQQTNCTTYGNQVSCTTY